MSKIHSMVLAALFPLLASMQAATAPKPKNIAPSISLSGYAPNYLEGSSPAPVDPSASLQDPDSPDFDSGQLKVDWALNGQDNDVLSVQSQGRLSLSGSTLRWDGKSAGTFSGGKSRAALLIKFTAAATREAVEAVIQNVTYACVSTAPSTLPRTLNFTVTDGDGGTSPTVSKVLTVTPVNDPPVVTLAAASQHYKENGPPLVLDAAATLTDDSASFGGFFLVDFTAGGTTDDRLGVQNAGTHSKQVGVAGAQILYSGQPVATFSGGQDLLPLEIDFSNTSLEAAKAVLDSIAFWNISDNPSTATRTVRVVATDSDGASSAAAARKVEVAAVNDPPALQLTTASLSYTEGSPPLVLDPQAAVTDPDSPNFDKGKLTVDYQSGGSSDDRLVLTDSNGIHASGSGVSYHGSAIGTVAGGSGVTPLTVTFNASATLEAAQALLESVAYSNVSKAPSTTQRILRWIITDGDGGTSDKATIPLAVLPVNDPPVVVLSTGSVTFTENSASVLIDAAATVTDDSADFAGGLFTAELMANAQSSDHLALDKAGAAVRSSGASAQYKSAEIGLISGTSTRMVIALNSRANAAALQALLRSLTFSNDSENPSALPRALRVLLDDGHGGQSAAAARTIQVKPVNDPPVMVFSSAPKTYVESSEPLLLDPAATVTDPDSDFDQGKLTVTLANVQTEDRLEILSLGDLDVEGSSLYWQGILIGGFSGGSARLPLTVNFNGQAGPAGVQAVLRSIAYLDISDSPVVKSRTASLTLTDGDGGTTATVTKVIQVAAVPDPPVIVIPSDPINAPASRAILAVAPTASVSDADTSNFTNGVLIAHIGGSLGPNGGAEMSDRLFFQGQGAQGVNLVGTNLFFGKIGFGSFRGGANAEPLVANLNAKATQAITQNLLETLCFEADSDAPAPLTRVITITLYDGAGATSSEVYRSIVFPQPPPVVISTVTKPVSTSVPVAPAAPTGVPIAAPVTATPPATVTITFTTAPVTPPAMTTPTVTTPVTTPPVTTAEADSDHDGLPDAWEMMYFGNLDQDGEGDLDGDGLSNAQELALGTNPNNDDTDGNGITDGYEDQDGDGRILLDEIRFGSDPAHFDTPDAPPLATVTREGQKVTVAWDPAAGPVSTYIIYRNGIPSGTISGSTTVYNDSVPLSQPAPLYQIQAVYPNGLSTIGVGMSVPLLAVTAYVPPPDPGSLRLWLDQNHDGVIDPTDGGPDAPNDGKPFRFWVNDDSDFTYSPVDSESFEVKSKMKDSDYAGLQSIRDLEDFARLWMGGVPALSSDDQVQLSWQGGGPTIDLYYSADADAAGNRDGGDRYLRDDGVASQQTTPGSAPIYPWGTWEPGVRIGRLAAGSTLTLPSILFGNRLQYFLFTASTAGHGNLLLTLLHKGVATQQTHVALDIRDIRDLYESAVITGVQDDPGSPAISSFMLRSTLAREPGESHEVIVFVHGWDMSQWDYENFSATFFKRLYWQGFQGRMESVRWPTFNPDSFGVDIEGVNSLRSFNVSEFRAYRSGAGLAAFLKDLRQRFPDDTIGLAAHSMGNVVSAEALKILAAQGQKPIDNYAMLQAAFPAEGYDPSASRYLPLVQAETTSPTPDSYNGYAGAIDQAVKGAIVNFINANDFALVSGRALHGTLDVSWVGNQTKVKPDNSGDRVPYLHLAASLTPRNYGSDGATGWELIAPSAKFSVTNPHELMAFVARSRTLPAGALSGIKGPLSREKEVDLGLPISDGGIIGLNRGRNEHSGEFNWNIQHTHGFYHQLIISLGMNAVGPQ